MYRDNDKIPNEMRKVNQLEDGAISLFSCGMNI